jgi:AcrR family transcriptional regulator
MVLACKAAGVSRNTAYAHLRKDARFRRQWEHALNQGFDAVDRAYWKEIGADPVIQRMIQRAQEARQWCHERNKALQLGH